MPPSLNSILPPAASNCISTYESKSLSPVVVKVFPLYWVLPTVIWLIEPVILLTVSLELILPEAVKWASIKVLLLSSTLLEAKVAIVTLLPWILTVSDAKSSPVFA